jgi:hypothetical protein
MNEDPEVIRILIHQENEMVNHRIQWFLLLQGFMFAGIGFAWEKNTALCIVFSIVGILSSVSAGLLLRCGIQAIADLDRKVQETTVGKKSDELNPFLHFLLPWNFMPLTMILAWAAMILIKIGNIG